MPITHTDFAQRARRHRPNELLEALAATSVQLFDKQAWLADRDRLP